MADLEAEQKWGPKDEPPLKCPECGAEWPYGADVKPPRDGVRLIGCPSCQVFVAAVAE